MAQSIAQTHQRLENSGHIIINDLLHMVQAIHHIENGELSLFYCFYI